MRSRESIRKNIVFLIFIFFILLPGEGILRKWLLKDLEKPLLLIRDPVALLIYIQYLRFIGGNIKLWLKLWAIGLLFLAGFGLAQAFVLDLPLPVILLGLRAYAFFIPLCFIAGETVTLRDFYKFVRVVLILAIPTAILVFLQFRSPVAAEINRGLSDEVEGRFTVIQGIVRPYGPFTFVQAQVTFGVLALAALIIAWTNHHKYKFGRVFLIISSTAVATMGALSGSRTFFGSAVVLILAYLTATVFTGRSQATIKILLTATLFIGFFILVFTVIFPDSFAAMTERQTEAEYTEGSTIGRYFGGLLEAFDALGTAPLMGQGLGVGSNGGAFVLTGAVEFLVAENEWPRIILELGPLAGPLVIGIRLVFVGWLGLAAIRAVLRKGDPTAMILFGFSGLLLFSGQISSQNQLMSFAWLSAGLTLAAAKLGSEEIPPDIAWRPLRLRI
jgi:hypothetical protein